MDPVSTTVFSGINASLKLAEYWLRVADASEDKRMFCKLIERVHKDRSEAIRERLEKAAHLKLMPSKKAWVDGAIADTEQALYEIGRTVEPGRFEATKKLTLKQRFEWVLIKKETLLTKQSLLAFCHQTLSTAISFMHDLPSPEQEQQLQVREQQPAPKKQIGSQVRIEEVDYVPSGPPPSYTFPGASITDNPAPLQSPWARRPKMKKDRATSEPAMMPAQGIGFASPFSGRRLDCHSQHFPRLLTPSLDELDRIMSDSSSISSSQPQLRWDDISNSGTADTAVEVFAEPADDSQMTKSKSLGNLQFPPQIANDRRRRHEARFGGKA